MDASPLYVKKLVHQTVLEQTGPMILVKLLCSGYLHEVQSVVALYPFREEKAFYAWLNYNSVSL